MTWTDPNDELPPLNMFVIAKLNKTNWIHDDPNVTVTVVERRHDEYPDGNNQREYYWDSFGGGTYFGQEVIRWMYIPQ
jgi:hypothetical protein